MIRFAILIAALFLVSCGQGSTSQWMLPTSLNEVSGLATSGEHHVLMHDDEKARVYELDLSNGAIRPAFQIHQPVLLGDFEGIAILDRDVYLTDSRGTLYHIVDGLDQNGEIVQTTKLSTQSENICEFEGLTTLEKRLLLLCKTSYQKDNKRDFMVLAYDPQSEEVELFLKVPLKNWGLKKLNPSGFTTTNNGLLIVAAEQRKLLRITLAGELLESINLDKRLHRQPEGIAALADGRVLIADEGKSKGGKITQRLP